MIDGLELLDLRNKCRRPDGMLAAGGWGLTHVVTAGTIGGTPISQLSTATFLRSINSKSIWAPSPGAVGA